MNTIKNLDLNSLQILLYWNFIYALSFHQSSIPFYSQATSYIKKQDYSVIYSIIGVSIVITKLSSFSRFIRIEKFHVKFPLNSSHFAEIYSSTFIRFSEQRSRYSEIRHSKEKQQGVLIKPAQLSADSSCRGIFFKVESFARAREKRELSALGKLATVARHREAYSVTVSNVDAGPLVA